MPRGFAEFGQYAGRPLARVSLLVLGVALSACSTTPTAPPVAAAPALDPAAVAAFEQGLELLRAQQWAEAQTRFAALCAEHPELPGPWVNLGVAQWQSGDLATGRATLEAASDRFPDYAPAAEQLARLLRSQGEFKRADEAYVKALQAEPDAPRLLYNRAVLNDLYLQQPETALQLFERYQRLMPDDKQVERFIVELRRRVPAAEGAAS